MGCVFLLFSLVSPVVSMTSVLGFASICHLHVHVPKNLNIFSDIFVLKRESLYRLSEASFANLLFISLADSRE